MVLNRPQRAKLARGLRQHSRRGYAAAAAAMRRGQARCGGVLMGMYRIEVSRVADRDRQAIIDLLRPDADDGRVFNGTVTGIGTISAFYEDREIAYALAFQCRMTTNSHVHIDYCPTDCPMREKREQAAAPLTEAERRQCAPLNGNRNFRLLR
jgi:hypothetical protein